MSAAVTSVELLRRLRTRAQGLDLHSGTSGDVAATVARMCGIQAQAPRSAALAIRARSTGLTLHDVERARVEQRSLIRTWAMRGSLHLIPAEDASLLVPLVGPPAIAGTRARYAQLGLKERTIARALGVIEAALAADGALTRRELETRLRRRRIDPRGQRGVHLIRRAALEGLICHGPERDGEAAFVLMRDWSRDPGVHWENAAAELARRYLRGYGPATPEDLAAWAGISLADARRAWKSIGKELAEMSMRGEPLWTLAEDNRRSRGSWSGGGTVRLLPAFDPYLLGYRGRDVAVAREHSRRVHPGGGVLRPVVVVDGRVRGTWALERRSGDSAVVVSPFGRVATGVRTALEAEAADIGRFFGEDIRLDVKRAP